MPGPINRHDKLRDGELPRRYWRLRDEDLSDRDELGLDPDLEVDEYWDPDLPASALDFRLQRAWEEVLSVAFAPSLADFVSESMRETWTASATTPSSPQIAAADLATALRTHLETVIGDEHPHDYLAKLQQAGRLDDIRAAVVRTPVLGRWFAHQRGPAVMALVVAPFWIRSLVEWSPPDDTTDLVAVTVSLVDHLLVRYPLPKPLYRA